MIAAGRPALAPKAPLAVPTESASPLAKKQDARRAAYTLRDVASALLPGERVEACGWRPVTAEGVAITRKGERYGVGNVRVCGSVWTCPVCAVKVAATRADELSRAIVEWRRRGGAVWLVTFTVAHTKHDDLGDNLRAFTSALRAFSAGKGGGLLREAAGVVGQVRNLETTWGAANGWHPHAHALWFVRGDVTDEQHATIVKDAKERWLGVLERFGLSASMAHGLRVSVERPKVYAGEEVDEATWVKLGRPACVEEVRDWDDVLADYVTKLISAENIEAAWTGAQELTWSHIKRARGDRFTPWMLLAAAAAPAGTDPDADEAGNLAPALFQEYAAAFKGRRQLYWSKGLRALLEVEPERTDEDLAEATDEDAVVVVHVVTPVWTWLRRRGLVPQLLEEAETHGDAALIGFIEDACLLARSHQGRYLASMLDALPFVGRGSLSA